MRFLNPKTDFAFKKIFGSENSRDILISFLNAVLELDHPYLIQEVDILDPYLAPKIQGVKDTYLDVRVRDEKGRSYVIEMQVLNVAGFEKRILYNACKAYVNQIGRGEHYTELCEVIAITITDFVMFEELAGIQSRFRMRAEENPEIYHGDLELIFVELPKFRKGEEDLESVYDKWLYFMKSAGDLKAIPVTLAQEPAIVHAFEIANKAGLTEEELEDQERREIYIQDQRGALQYATVVGMKQGMEQGMQQGMQQGMLEGKLEGKLEVAKSMLEKGMTRDQVAEFTGLNQDELQLLEKP